MERTWYSLSDVGNCEARTQARLIIFRPDGTYERTWTPDGRGSGWSVLYGYDGGGRLKTVDTADPDGRKSTRTYQYDAAGRLCRILERRSPGLERVAEVFVYLTGGRTLYTRHLDSDRCMTTFWSVPGSDACFAGNGAVAIRTIFDVLGRPRATLFLDANDCIVNRVVLRYNALGQVIDETSASDLGGAVTHHNEANGLRTRTRRLFRYDSFGRRTAVVMPSQHGVRKIVTRYNDRGDEILTSSYDTERNSEGLSSDGEATVPSCHLTHESHTRFRYEYDRHGNWVRQTVEGRVSPHREFSKEYSERRLITYFAI